MTWFKRYNARYYNNELSAFKKYDIDYSVDEVLKKKGAICIDIVIRKDNQYFKLQDVENDITLRIGYPDLYPFFRPEVVSRDINLPRHQNPVLGNICLLPRESLYWNPEETVAEFLLEQLPKVMMKGNITDENILSNDTDEQAEPVSEYYATQIDSPVVFDTSYYDSSFEAVSEIRELGKVDISTPAKIKDGVRFLVTKCYDNKNNDVGYGVDGGDTFTDEQKCFAKIYRLPSAPDYDPNKAFEYLKIDLKKKNTQPEHLRKKYPLGNGMNIICIIGLTFPEEIAPGKDGPGWLFMIRVAVIQPTRIGKNVHKVPVQKTLFTRVSRINDENITVRVPLLKSLRDKVISIFGTGAIGAPAAIEFARNGVKELRLIDYDIVDAATTVRWPFGISAAGRFKVDVLKSYIENNYPSVNVIVEKIRVGLAFQPKSPTVDKNQMTIINRMFDCTSLIFDASAEIGVMNYLSYEAGQKDVPYVCISATEGAVGGLVMRVDPRKEQGCWMCMKYSQEEGTIPVPVSDNSGKVQPIGCGDPTFTGASFDLNNVSMAGVRLAISTLCNDAEDSYPSLDWDIGVLSLIDESKNAIFPKWDVYKLNVHPNCPYCNTND